MSNTVLGTAGEDRSDYTKAENRAVRRRSLKLLGTLLRPVRMRVALVLGVVVLQTGLRVLGPALIGLGIDRALPAVIRDGDWGPTFEIGGIYAGTALLGALVLAWYTVLAATVTEHILLDLRTRMFRHTQELSLEFHESYTSGRVISRQTSDMDSFRELLDGGLNSLLNGALFAGFTFVALAVVDWRSALVLVASFIPLALLLRWFAIASRRAYRQTRVASARMIVKFVETMTGIRAGKAFRVEDRNEVEFAETAGEYRSSNVRAIRIFGVFEPGLMAIGAVVMGVVVIWGGIRVIDGALTAGVLLAAVLYVRSFFGPLREIAMFLNSFQSASAALEKMSGVLEETPAVPEPSNPTRLDRASGRVTFDDVTFGYGTGKTILPSFTLDIPAGQTVAVVGSTGAGKSTLAKLLSRFYDPSEGAVQLDGVDLRTLLHEDLTGNIVMVTQEAYLFAGTVADNIQLGKPDASRDEIVAAARAVGADAFIRALPDGYDTDVNKRGGRVSAGQRQLISFARAFLADPSVLILDEATASLDMPSERMIQEALQTLLADRTAVIIAHRLSTVQIADRVLVMEQGRIVEDDTPAALIDGGGRFAKLHAAWRDSLV